MEAITTAIPELLEQDLFFLNLENDTIEWLYYNPDSVAGGQFVINVFNQDLLEDAVEGVMDVEDIFEYIENNCRQYLADRGTAAFGEAWKRMQNSEPFAEGCSFTTVENIRLAYLAKDHLNAYCQREFKMDAEFADLRKIAIGYTTITDAEHDVQSYANLIDHRIEIYLNGNIAEYLQHSSLLDMVHNTLPTLEFDDLISIPGWVIKNHEHTAAMDSLATRLTFFMKEFDPHAYADVMEVGDTDANMIAKMRADLKDTELIPGIIEELETIIKEEQLSNDERERCYDMMTDLYHLYAEQMYVPAFDRETDVLSRALAALGVNDSEISFDDEGIYLTRGGKQWHNGDIYRYLGNSIPLDAWRQFRYNCFPDYTDFKDIAEHYGVPISWHLKPVPVARIDFLSPKGIVGESINFTTESEFLKHLKEYLEYGVPLSVVLYRGLDGKTISRDFLNDLDTPPKSVTVENARVLSPEDRGVAR